MSKLIILALVFFCYNFVDGAPRFQGDILIDEGKRSWGLPAQNQNWPNGIVPYEFSAAYSFSAENIEAVELGMKTIEENSCVRFIRRTSEINYLNIIRDSGCYSFVGLIYNGAQDVSYGEGCLSQNTIMHELFHALGFYHEQSREDRDQFITIHFENVRAGTERNFQIQSGGSDHGTQYDYTSVMHYHPYSFAIDRSKETIVAKNGAVIERIGLSQFDISALNTKYQCETIPVTETITEGVTTTEEVTTTEGVTTTEEVYTTTEEVYTTEEVTTTGVLVNDIIFSLKNNIRANMKVFYWDGNKAVFLNRIKRNRTFTYTISGPLYFAILNQKTRKNEWIYVDSSYNGYEIYTSQLF